MLHVFSPAGQDLCRQELLSAAESADVHAATYFEGKLYLADRDASRLLIFAR